MSEPMYCEIRGHYCRCHDYGKRCDDFDDSPPSHLAEHHEDGQSAAPCKAKESK